MHPKAIAIPLLLAMLLFAGCADSGVMFPDVPSPVRSSVSYPASIPSLSFFDLAQVDEASATPRPGATSFLSGDHIVTVSWERARFAQASTGKLGPMETTLTLTFDPVGRRALAQWTSEHPGSKYALVLGGRVVSVVCAVLPETEGTMQITGDDVAAMRAAVESATVRSAP